MAKAKVDLRSPIFHDEDAARAHLESVLWPQGPVCPRCGVMGDRVTKLAGKSTRPGVYKCKDCRKPFSVTVGTVMERSHIPLSQWVLAAHFMASSKKGFSAHELHRVLDTSYEAAWFLFHRLRLAADDLGGSGPLGGENKVVEVDEVYIGGKEKNKHASKRKHVKGGAVGKMAVVSLVERDGRTRSFHVANVNSKTLRAVSRKARGSRVLHYDRRTRSLSGCDQAASRRAWHGSPHFGRVRADGRLSPHQHGRKPFRADQARDHRNVPQHQRGSLGPLSRRVRFPREYPRPVVGRGNGARFSSPGAKGKRLMYRQPDFEPKMLKQFARACRGWRASDESE